MLLGYARGKVGSLVFARRKGVQITRAYNANPANPRTPAQINQRMKMYAPTNFYKKLRAKFFPFAFEDQKPNETPYNAFMRHNIAVSPWVSKPLASEYAPIPFRTVMSEGSLVAADFDVMASYGGYGESIRQDSYVALELSDAYENDTVAQVSLGLKEKYGLSEGDLVSFVGFRSVGLSVEGGNVLYDGVGAFRFYYQQFVIDSQSDESMREKYTSLVPLHNAQAPTGPSSRLGLQIGNAEDMDVDSSVSLGGCVIFSHRDGSTVRVSSAVMELNDFAANRILSTMLSQTFREEAANTYLVSDADYLNPDKEI